MNGIEAAQLIVRRPAKQADVWPADIDSGENIADSCPDRQHAISACLEGGRQRFGEHPLLITDNYSHYDYPPAALVELDEASYSLISQINETCTQAIVRKAGMRTSNIGPNIFPRLRDN
jgi:hypothetical protein